VQPIPGEFSHDILFDGFRRYDVGFAAGKIARLQLGEASSV
jgi:hypothetical protein